MDSIICRSAGPYRSFLIACSVFANCRQIKETFFKLDNKGRIALYKLLILSSKAFTSASVDDVNNAVNSAENGFTEMKKLSAHERYEKLMKASVLIEERKEDLARTIKKAYYATTSFIDAQVGRVLDKLKETGLKIKIFLQKN